MNEQQLRTKRALQALRAADQSGMGRIDGGMGATATDRLADLDACTLAYRTWSPALIPGHLQTDSYAASAIRARTPSLGMDQIELRVTHRRRRAQAFLGRRAGMPATYAWLLTSQAAISRPITDMPGHAEQLRHLLAIAQDYDNLVVQVLPDDSPQPGAIEPFEIFHLDPGPVVGHVESIIGGWYTASSEDHARLHSAFSDLSMWALSPTESYAYITEALATCREHIEAHGSSNPLTPTRATASTSPGPIPDPSE